MIRVSATWVNILLYIIGADFLRMFLFCELTPVVVQRKIIKFIFSSRFLSWTSWKKNLELREELQNFNLVFWPYFLSGTPWKKFGYRISWKVVCIRLGFAWISICITTCQWHLKWNTRVECVGFPTTFLGTNKWYFHFYVAFWYFGGSFIMWVFFSAVDTNFRRYSRERLRHAAGNDWSVAHHGLLPTNRHHLGRYDYARTSRAFWNLEWFAAKAIARSDPCVSFRTMLRQSALSVVPRP